MQQVTQPLGRLMPSPEHWSVRGLCLLVMAAVFIHVWFLSWDGLYIWGVLFLALWRPSRIREILLMGVVIYEVLPTRPFQIARSVGYPVIWDLTEYWANLNGVNLSHSSVLIVVHSIAAILALVLAWYLIRWAPQRIRQWPFVAFTTVLMLSATLFQCLSHEYSLTGLTVLSFTCVWAELLISAVMIQNTVGGAAFSWTEMWKVMPFWNASSVPYWEFQKFPDSKTMLVSANEMRWRVIGMGILFLVIFIPAFHFFLDSYDFSGTGDWTSINDYFDGPAYAVRASASALGLWLGIVLRGTGFMLLRLALVSSVPALILMALGIPAKFNVQNPHQATSLHSFFARLYYYYNRAMVVICFRPVIARLGFLRRWPSLRILLAVLLSIQLFGFIFHVIRDFQIIIVLGLIPTLLMRLRSHFIYFLLMGLGSGISAIWPRGAPKKVRSRLMAFQFPLYIGVLSLLYFFGRPYPAILADRLYMLRYLFTGVR